jgi:hypothetical protein
MLKAAGEAETMQENIQDWLVLDEGDSEFQLVVLSSFLNTGCTYLWS